MTGVLMASAGARPLKATLSPPGDSESGLSRSFSFGLSVSASGGSGRYGYAWSLDQVLGDSGTSWTFTAPTQASTSAVVSGVGGGGGQGQAVISCTVTDLVTGRTASTGGYSFIYFNFSGGHS